MLLEYSVLANVNPMSGNGHPPIRDSFIQHTLRQFNIAAIEHVPFIVDFPAKTL